MSAKWKIKDKKQKQLCSNNVNYSQKEDRKISANKRAMEIFTSIKYNQ